MGLSKEDDDPAVLGRHNDVVVVSVKQLSSMIDSKAITSIVAVIANIPNVGTEIARV